MPRGQLPDCRQSIAQSAGCVLLPVTLLVLLALGTSCAPTRQSGTVEDTQTSGRITVVASPELHALLDREAAAFRVLYPQATITIVEGTSRDAVGRLLSQQVDLIAVGRELQPEERNVTVKGGMELEGYRFARDGMVVVVNPSNPVSHLSAEDLREVFLGQVTDWSALGRGHGPIEPVLQPLASDAGVSMLQQVMGGQAPTASAHAAANDAEVVARVARTPGALGLVSMHAVTPGVKVVPVSALQGLAPVTADVQSVYKGEYPLTRFQDLYVRSTGPRLANGFITYITSLDGQKLVHEAGLVPTAVPVRFVHRSPMLGSH